MHIIATVFQQPVEESEYGSADLFSDYNFDFDILDDLRCYKRRLDSFLYFNAKVRLLFQSHMSSHGSIASTFQTRESAY